MPQSHKACPFVDRECLAEGCLAWGDEGCMLMSRTEEGSIKTPFEQKLQSASPLMYRSLLDLVKVMEDMSRDCTRCGPDLWNYAQEVRACLLDDLIKAELAEAGIRAVRKE
jgi:hypothetical protein